MDTELGPGGVLGGRFTLVRSLGSGGYGVVWLATDADGGAVAIKVLHPAIREEGRAVERLVREGELLLSLDHPNIASARHFEVGDDAVYLVMEFVDGRTLSADLRWRGRTDRPLSFETVAARVRSIGGALTAAHAAGIVHRDVKPQNVMITGEGDDEHVLVLDFGIARILDSDAHDATTLGRRIGSPMYMAPEQILGHRAEPQSDVFALGCLLFEMTTLRRCWARHPDGAAVRAFVESVSGGPNGGVDVFRRVIHGPRPVPSAYRRDAPPALDDVVARALSVDLDIRFRSAHALVSATCLAIGEADAEAPATELTRRPVSLATAIAALEHRDDDSLATEAVPRPHSAGGIDLPTVETTKSRLVVDAPDVTPTFGDATPLLPPTPPTPRRLQWPVRSLVLVLGAAAIGIAFSWRTARRSPREIVARPEPKPEAVVARMPDRPSALIAASDAGVAAAASPSVARRVAPNATRRRSDPGEPPSIQAPARAKRSRLRTLLSAARTEPLNQETQRRLQDAIRRRATSIDDRATRSRVELLLRKYEFLPDLDTLEDAVGVLEGVQ